MLLILSSRMTEEQPLWISYTTSSNDKRLAGYFALAPAADQGGTAVGKTRFQTRPVVDDIAKPLLVLEKRSRIRERRID